MKHMKVRSKLVLGFGLILILFSLATWMSSGAMSTMNKMIGQFDEDAYQVMERVDEVKYNVEASSAITAQMVLAVTQKDVDALYAEYQAHTQNLVNDLTYLLENYPEYQNQVKIFRGLTSSSDELSRRIYSLSLTDKETAQRLYKNELLPAAQKASEALGTIDEAVQQQKTALLQNSVTRTKYTQTIILLVTAASFGVAIVMGLAIIRMITKPLNEIEKAAQGMAEGDLNVEITYQSRDEIGSLAENMREMTRGYHSLINDISYMVEAMSKGDFCVNTQDETAYKGDFAPILKSLGILRDNLSETLQQINESADQVSGSAEQIASGAQVLSQSSTEQANSVEELVASLQGMNTSIHEVVAHVTEGQENLRRTNQQVDTGHEQMQVMQKAMTEINASSNNIQKIIKDIDDIAFQTNILALNAAVEAARAGTAGKGFAVVADEVRNLAQKSAESAKTTAQLIEQSIQAVQKGQTITGEIAQTIDNMAAEAKNSLTLMEQISMASTEQADAVDQVLQGAEQISAVVQTNSATAEESAASSEELSGQANILKELVKKFRLSNEQEYLEEADEEDKLDRCDAEYAMAKY